jgi:hypothetical protein
VNSTNRRPAMPSTKVGKSDREGTFSGAHGNGEVAPIPDLPALARNGEVRPKSRKAAFVATAFLFGEVGRSSGGVIDIPPTALALRVPAVAGLLRNF